MTDRPPDLHARMDPLAEMAALVPAMKASRRRATDFWFLASPYSKYPHGIEAAFNLAVQARGMLLKAKVPVFSPIIHSHPVAVGCGLDPFDHDIWLPSELPILHLAYGMIQLRAEGWQDSKGMAYEEMQFRMTGRPIVPMTPGIVPDLP